MIRTVHTQARFSRRRFLRRVGGSAALLPLLHSERARGAGPSGFPKRLVTVAWGNGMARPFFYPPGNDPTESKIMAPLAPLKSKVTLVGALDFSAMLDGGHKYDGHFAFPTMFTGTYKNMGGQRSAAAGPSLDQVVSDAAAKTVNLPVPLLTLSAAGSSISFRADGGQNTAETDPGRLFTKLFSNRAMPPAQLAGLRARRKSVLDYVTGELGAFQKRVGGEDRARIGFHLDSVRKLELELSSGGAAASCMPVAPTTGGDFRAKVKAFNDMIAMALRCDVTRAVSLVLAADGGSNPSALPFLMYGGVPGAGAIGEVHALAHMGAPGYPAKTIIDTFFVAQLAYLATALDGVQEGSGTVLDNSLIVMGNDMSENHYVGGVPFILVGRAGGALKTGRNVRLGAYASQAGDYWKGDSHVPNNHLLATIANAFDVPTSAFGSPMFSGNLDSMLM